MEGYYPLRLKRKDLEDVSEDFSDFSLSSPARKIRRLDAELPPIIEEEERDISIEFEDTPPTSEHTFGSNSTGGIKIEELPDEPSNEERAIVLFNPNQTTPLPHSPSSFSVSINPSFISGLKNQVLWSNQSSSWKLTNDGSGEENDYSSGSGCLAVVPWVPSHFSSGCGSEYPPQTTQTDTCEMMDAQEVKEATMEIEEMDSTPQSNGHEAGGVNLNEQFQQWQQQHCLFSQPPHNTTPTPVVWYR